MFPVIIIFIQPQVSSTTSVIPGEWKHLWPHYPSEANTSLKYIIWNVHFIVHDIIVKQDY